MDKVFIQSLTRQALTAYTNGGQAALDQWKADLPSPHLAGFEKYCSEPLREAIAALAPVLQPIPQGDAPEEDIPADDPRRRHKSDPRRAKPI